MDYSEIRSIAFGENREDIKRKALIDLISMLVPEAWSINLFDKTKLEYIPISELEDSVKTLEELTWN